MAKPQNAAVCLNFSAIKIILGLPKSLKVLEKRCDHAEGQLNGAQSQCVYFVHCARQKFDGFCAMHWA